MITAIICTLLVIFVYIAGVYYHHMWFTRDFYDEIVMAVPDKEPKNHSNEAWYWPVLWIACLLSFIGYGSAYICVHCYFRIAQWLDRNKDTKP